jgi:hypothetical protein
LRDVEAFWDGWALETVSGGGTDDAGDDAIIGDVFLRFVDAETGAGDAAETGENADSGELAASARICRPASGGNGAGALLTLRDSDVALKSDL